MKKSKIISFVFTAILSIISLNLISAAGITPSQLFSNVVWIYAIVFVIFFIVLNFAMSRVFPKGPAGLIAFCVSLLGVVGLNQIGFDMSKWLFKIGINENNIATILPIVLLIFLILISRKKDKTTGKRKFLWQRPFLLLGALFIIVGLTDLVYQKIFSIILGIVLFVLGLLILNRKRKKNKIANASWKEQEDYKQKLKDKSNKKNNSGGSSPKSTKEDYERNVNKLIEEARTFKKWVRTSRQTRGNPKFYGNWAMFINYLRQRNWGKNEKKICENFGINQRDFVKIFNRYGRV